MNEKPEASEKGVRRRTGGRSARVRAAVLEATLQVISERNSGVVGIGEIARRAGVHETSLYRRWGSAGQLFLDALLNHGEQQLSTPDTGSLRDDLCAIARSAAAALDTPLGAALTRSMAASDDDPDLAAGRARFWSSRVETTRVVIDRAVARGELPPGTDAALALELLVAPLYFRALLTRWPVDDDLVERTVDALLHGLARDRPAGRP
ncbi:TetR/AcrR family transcriptional regulator [Kitasatospora sp. NPDC015120]|uniref:TetR/AcrR family transcriptional regulator n=1 Tax=Kitasatospora sp. NPDC015120 TaxID=3364023 RepID=UPI0036F47A68